MKARNQKKKKKNRKGNLEKKHYSEIRKIKLKLS